MLDLVGDVVLAALSIAETAAILLTFGFKVARGLDIGVIFVFLPTESLVDQMDKDTLTEVA